MTEESTKPALDSIAAKPSLSFVELMPRVASEYGKSLGGQLKDLLGLCMRGNKLSIDEYYNLRLFDDATYDANAKKTFAGLQKSRQIWTELMAVNRYLGLVDDKLAYEKFMRSFGFAVPETLAIAGGNYPATMMKLGSAAALAGFLRETRFPVFGKPVNSYQSLGSARLESFDTENGNVHLSSGASLHIEQFWAAIEDEFEGNYLFQKCVEVHPDLMRLCGGGVPTMRVVTVDRGNGPEIYRAVAKLTGNRNVADNFWREGNLLAAIDVETGSFGKAIDRMGIDRAFLADHPETGERIEGFGIPFWAETRQAALDAMRLLPGSAIIGFDIAIDGNGPVIIEANNDPHLIMLQIAHEKGVLDEMLLEALDHAGKRQKKERQDALDTFAAERVQNKKDLRAATSRKAA